MDERPIVVKVGGSLFDLPDLGMRLQGLLDGIDSSRLLLVPGGGPTTDAVRQLDRLHNLGQETCHWLALYALTLNAHFLATLLKRRATAVVATASDWREAWRAGRVPIIDSHALLRADENSPDRLPHSWDVTGDSVAARLAIVCRARQLILLKSASFPSGIDWIEAGRRGLVDSHFARALERSPSDELEIKFVNFRQWQRGSREVPQRDD
jgi:aspartokinase-like uncharacterized kinase